MNKQTCKVCGKLIKKSSYKIGLCEEHEKVLRKSQVSPSLSSTPSESERLLDQSVTYEVSLYDGRVVLRVSDEEEKKFVELCAKDYENLEFDMPDPYNDLTALLLYRLEANRIALYLSGILSLAPKNRKSLHESLNMTNNQIKSIQEKLGITRDKIQKRKGSPEEMFPIHMKEFAKYRAENEHVFRGIGVCSKCNDRIIFKSYLPTFESFSVEKLKELSKDCESKETLILKYEEFLKNFGCPEIYSEEVRRLVEEGYTEQK